MQKCKGRKGRITQVGTGKEIGQQLREEWKVSEGRMKKVEMR